MDKDEMISDQLLEQMQRLTKAPYFFFDEEASLVEDVQETADDAFNVAHCFGTAILTKDFWLLDAEGRRLTFKPGAKSEFQEIPGICSFNKEINVGTLDVKMGISSSSKSNLYKIHQGLINSICVRVGRKRTVFFGLEDYVERAQKALQALNILQLTVLYRLPNRRLRLKVKEILRNDAAECFLKEAAMLLQKQLDGKATVRSDGSWLKLNPRNTNACKVSVSGDPGTFTIVLNDTYTVEQFVSPRKANKAQSQLMTLLDDIVAGNVTVDLYDQNNRAYSVKIGPRRYDVNVLFRKIKPPKKTHRFESY